MNIKALVLAVWLLLGLSACHSGSQPMTARDNPDAPTGGKGPNQGKPDPNQGKLLEKVKALQLQRPTLNEADFLNLMDLDFNGEDRALFSFSYAPEENGSLFFSRDQVRLYLKDCTKSTEREAKIQVYWQEVQGDKRRIVGVFKDSIHEFEFTSGNKYILSYVLMDLKEFADCKSATLKFAAFLKNYK